MTRAVGMVVAIAAMIGAAPVVAQVAPEGCWSGTLGQGAEQRRVVLELWKSPEGAWGARLHRLTSKVGTDSMGATIAGNAVTFKNEKIAFMGTLSEDGKSLAGEVEREGKKYPVALAPVRGDDVAGQALVGNWAGSLEQNGVPVLRLVIKVSAAPCGQVLVTMDSPDQGASDLPVTSLGTASDSLHFEMKYVGGRYDGAIDPEHAKIAGTWAQGGLAFKLNLARTDSLPVLRRPQEPKKPYPYREEEVTYENVQQRVKFAGTLTLPQGPGPFPAVLLLTGSGAQDRDETLMGHKPFLVLADHLTRLGIAVLRVDDRGIGGSTGDLLAGDLEDFASDALAGVKYLRSRKEIASKKIGLIGHSEGALVAPMAATHTSDVAFIVLLAGPGVPLEELLLEQAAAIARASGASEPLIEAGRKASKSMYAILASEPVDSTAQRRIKADIASTAPTLAAARHTPADSAIVRAWETQVQGQMQMLTTRWFRHLLLHDPAPVLKKVRVPVLALFGAKDLQVPPAQNAPAVEAALRAGKNKDFTVEVLPELNHLFQHAKTGLVDEYARIEETLSPEALDRIGKWIGERTR